MTALERREEALSRARGGMSTANYSAIFMGFMDKGIPEGEINPRSNVFTYQAWRALGRQVKKGEHGVKVCTFVPCTKVIKKDDGSEDVESFRRPWGTTVFHISQTEPIQVR